MLHHRTVLRHAFWLCPWEEGPIHLFSLLFSLSTGHIPIFHHLAIALFILPSPPCLLQSEISLFLHLPSRQAANSASQLEFYYLLISETMTVRVVYDVTLAFYQTQDISNGRCIWGDLAYVWQLIGFSTSCTYLPKICFMIDL